MTGLRVCLVSGEYPPMQGGVGDYTHQLARHLAARGHMVAVATRSGPFSPRRHGDTEKSVQAWGECDSERSGAERGISSGEPGRCFAAAQHDGKRDQRSTERDGTGSGLSDEPGNPEVWRIAERWHFGTMTAIRRRATEWGADVVNLQYQAAAFDMHPAANLSGLLLKGSGGRPRVVVTFHDLKVPYLFPKAGPLRRLAVLLLAGTADGCITTNLEDWRALAASRLGRRSRAVLIPIGSNIPFAPGAEYERARWRAAMGVATDELLLAYFGFLNETKGVELLFEAMAALVERGRRVRLAMIGGTAGDSDPTNRPYERRIRALAEAPSLRDRVIWTGFVGPAAVSAHLLACDLCVLPFLGGASYRHGTLIAAIEHGVPILTTMLKGGEGRKGAVLVVPEGLPPLVHGENALLVPPRDVGALVEGVEGALADSRLLDRLREGTRALAPPFAWPAIAERSEELYRRVIGTAGTA